MLVLSPRIVNDPTSIVVGLPMSTQEYHATNPFAVPLHGKNDSIGYIITNQPKSFDWRLRNAKAHPWKQAPEDVFESACDKLNRVIAFCRDWRGPQGRPRPAVLYAGSRDGCENRKPPPCGESGRGSGAHGEMRLGRLDQGRITASMT